MRRSCPRTHGGDEGNFRHRGLFVVDRTARVGNKEKLARAWDCRSFLIGGIPRGPARSLWKSAILFFDLCGLRDRFGACEAAALLLGFIDHSETPPAPMVERGGSGSACFGRDMGCLARGESLSAIAGCFRRGPIRCVFDDLLQDPMADGDSLDAGLFARRRGCSDDETVAWIGAGGCRRFFSTSTNLRGRFSFFERLAKPLGLFPNLLRHPAASESASCAEENFTRFSGGTNGCSW